MTIALFSWHNDKPNSKGSIPNVRLRRFGIRFTEKPRNRRAIQLSLPIASGIRLSELWPLDMELEAMISVLIYEKNQVNLPRSKTIIPLQKRDFPAYSRSYLYKIEILSRILAGFCTKKWSLAHF